MQVTFLLSILVAAWIIFCLSMAFIDLKSSLSLKVERYFWNLRIDQLSRPPMNMILKVYEEKNYIKMCLAVIITNFLGHCMAFLMGLSLVGIVYFIFQVFLMGILIAQGDPKTKMYGVVTAVFEVSAFTLTCGIGFLCSWTAVTSEVGFGAATIATLKSYIWAPLLLLVGNGIVEACGVLIGAQGVPGVDNVKHKRYKK